MSFEFQHPFTAKDLEILYALVCGKEAEILRDWQRTQRRYPERINNNIRSNVEWRMSAYNSLGRKLIAIFDELTAGREVNVNESEEGTPTTQN